MKGIANCLLLTIFIFCALTISAQAQTSGMAPDFTLKDLYNQDVKLSSYLGKPVFLVFVTTWCPSCKAELPQLKSIYEKYKNKGLIMFNIDIEEPPEKVMSYVQKRNITFPVLLDTEGIAANRYGVVGVPTKVLIDRKGKLICWNCRTLEDKLKQLMP
jgi:peroxiredoxin